MKKTLMLSAIVLGLALGSANTASAGMVLTLNDPSTGGTDVTVSDADNDGLIVFNGAIGGTVWNINVTTALSDPAFVGSSKTNPGMDINSINVASAGAGTLVISLTDTDFVAPPSGTATSALKWGGTLTAPAGSTVRYDAFADDANAEFGTTDPIGTVGPFGPGAFSGTASDSFNVTGTYSLTQRLTIALTGAGQWSGDAELRAVPEPASLTLLGLGLLGMGAAARRRRLQSASN